MWISILDVLHRTSFFASNENVSGFNSKLISKIETPYIRSVLFFRISFVYLLTICMTFGYQFLTHYIVPNSLHPIRMQAIQIWSVRSETPFIKSIFFFRISFVYPLTIYMTCGYQFLTYCIVPHFLHPITMQLVSIQIWSVRSETLYIKSIFFFRISFVYFLTYFYDMSISILDVLHYTSFFVSNKNVRGFDSKLIRKIETPYIRSIFFFRISFFYLLTICMICGYQFFVPYFLPPIRLYAVCVQSWSV